MNSTSQDGPAREAGHGPLADTPVGGPIDDPALTDRANPRWDGTTPEPDAQPLRNADGSPDTMPPRSPQRPEDHPAHDRLTDAAARPLSGDDEVGRDNIAEGKGGEVSNPALAEGGDSG